MKFWEIKNELNSEKAELLIYKEIANEDWWDEGLQHQRNLMMI